MSSARFVSSVGYLVRLAALAAAVLIGPDSAEAQLGFGGAALSAFTSLGSAATETAERSESNVDRAAASSGRWALAAQVGPETFSGGSLSGLFNRGGLLGGFAAGFLGCGLLGILFGRGLFGDLDGTPSYLGLFVQLALVTTLCWLIWTRWRGGDAADLAALSPRQLADPYLRSRDDLRARFEAPPDEAHTPGPQDPSCPPHSAEVTDSSGKCK